MFGGTKPTFGTTTTGTGFGGFSSTTTSSPFGQSAFGKPAPTAFGAAPAFGTQQQTPSLFGTNTAQPQSTGLFGAANTTSAFGSTTTAQPAFGGFQQSAQGTSMFGAAQPAANTSSLFGQTTTSAFGSAVKPGTLGGFGQTAAQPTSSLFGQPAAAQNTSGFGSFGQAQQTSSNVFGAGTTMMMGANAGTSIAKYQPTIGTDTLMKGGQPNNVNTKQHCITAMKEYEGKSLEELRLEDYMANRKGPQAGTSGATTGFFGAQPQTTATGTGLFGASAQPSTGLFGQPAAATTENKGLFGTSAFGQTNTSAFGANTQQNSFLSKPFGAPATSGFGAATTDSSNLFGAKPAFGQTQPSLFGQTSTANTAPAFGQTNTGFGGFGTAAQPQQTSLFGAPTADANKPAFGLGTSSANTTGFGGFGATATSTAGTGLFGAKPATTGFGATPGFGQTSTANTGFTNFSLGNTGGGLFNSSLNKPPTTGFGAFGTQTSTAPLNFTGSSAPSMFGNAGAKPGGLFGSSLGQGTTNTGGGLFGTGGTGAFGTGGTLGGGFGTGTLGGGNMTLGGFGGNQQQQQPPIHQQILAKVTSPYGDNPIFKDLKRSDETDATRATNPAAQKAILESTANQFKVSTRSSPSVIRVKPITSALTKKSLFEGLEEFDSSVETFSLKPNAKRLIIKPKPANVIVGSSANTSPTRQPGLHDSLTSGGPRQAGGVADTSLSSAMRNESFSGQLPLEPPTSQNGRSNTAAVPPYNGRESDIGGRRESWLHPNNVEKLRQQNLNTSIDGAAPLNSTLTELVPRKPLDTYRPTSSSTTGTPTGRPSVSTVMENTFEEQTSREASRRELSEHQDESLFSNRSYGVEERSVVEEVAGEYEEHPTGITLRRIGYYTIPSLDDLKSYLAEDGTCIVPNFTVGREGYGNVYFGKEMDVARLNLDEIVHFRNKEIIIYPDDDNKPPVGSGLNREAQVTLDQVWPHDKTKHEPIKDAVRLADMDWEGKLRRVCDKNDTRFIEYRPETGSWVFRVKHFSKYGLNDSDEEDDGVPTDPKKAKMGVAQGATAGVAGTKAAAGSDKITMAALKNAQKISEDAARALDPKSLGAGGENFYAMDDSAEFMLMDKTQFLQANGNDYTTYESQQQQIARVTSPTAFLAREAGTDSHKLQLMKASFFGDDDQDLDNKLDDTGAGEIDFNYDYNRNQNRRAGLFKTNLLSSAASMQSLLKEPGYGGGTLSEVSSQLDFVMQPSSLPASSAASVISLAQEVDTERSTPVGYGDSVVVAPQKLLKMPEFFVKPKVASVKISAHQVPIAKSLAFNLKGRWAADLGLYNFRRFKLGFGPQNTIIVPTTRKHLDRDLQNEHLFAVSPYIFKGRGSHDYSATILQHIKISSVMHYEHFQESIVTHLEIQLRNSLQEDVEGSECPWIKADNGTDLIVKHLDEAIKQINLSPLEGYAVSVWSLCLALWGEHEELEGREPNSHFAVMCRRNLLSEWLENTLTDKDLLTKNVSKNIYLDHLLELVMCHKVTEACELAFRYDDANLALLLAQLSSGPTVRQLVEDQLAAWHKDEADKFIQLERLKLYMLVAGVALMDSAHGPINSLDGIEWIKVLAIQLWYLSSPTASITDALLAYEKSFKSEEFYSLPPTPCYIDKSNLNEKYALYDLRYHLMQLFSKRSHPLESLLNPATHTSDPMDYRLSWLLLQTLEAIGYRHCSELSESQLHVGFASQLENNDLWEWAIFVLLHIKNRNQRELSVQNVLYRYVSVSKDVALSEKEKFVINNLGVPEKWIDYAKAVKAGALGYHHMQAKYLLKAKQWALAHEVIFQHIAPDAIINDNLDYLHSLLCQFEGAEANKTIKVPNWSNQGQIFLDFIDINEKFKSLKTLKTEADIEARWENLKPQLADLCSRINLLPCPTAKHRLCQSEIAQNLACLVRGVLLVCPVLNPCLIIKIALERLPLPQEFAQQELRALLDTLVDDLAKVNASENNETILTK